MGGGDIVQEDLEADEPVYKRAEDCVEAEEDGIESGENESQHRMRST